MKNDKKLKIFVDSNVFIPGLYCQKGAPGTIITDYTLGKIDIVISQRVLNEIIIVLKEKLPTILPMLQKFLLSHPPEIVKDSRPESPEKWKGILNKNNAAILESAISCAPDYFITGDKHFFENPLIAKKSGLKIIKPKDFQISL